ncbi:DinB family protein [Runella sp.]|uniref:DinB family protein n=1 Tax=Runella sp. TaxID=1960881 RepID=UPI003D1042D7
MNLLQRTNLDVLFQLRDLLTIISYEAYSSPLPLLHGSSVGKHIRHTLEFYQCLFEQAPHGFVDYDARNRNMRLENDPAFSLSFIHTLEESLTKAIPQTPITLKTSFLGNESEHIQTSWARELVYMAEHAIHHFAVIKIALREQFPEITLPAHFGVAYSTIKYRESVNA